MRKAFTLIELMIVIAIIAIIASIAIPNLLESRITANEAAAASSLKAGLFPAQVQYQSGGYVDVDNDGRGCHAVHPACLAGATGAGTLVTGGPLKSLSLMDVKFAQSSAGQTGNTALGAVLTLPNGYGTIAASAATAQRVGSYDYAINISGTEDDAESFWGAVAVPKDTTGNEARRMFGITSSGSLYQSKGTVTQANTTVAIAFGTTANAMFAGAANSVTTSAPGPGSGAVPFAK